MKKNKLNLTFTTLTVALLTLALINVGCKKDSPNSVFSPKGLEDFTQVNLVANNAGYNTARIDPLLQDAWGIAFSPTGNIWLSANMTGYSTVYDKEGNQLLSPVAIPSPTSANGGTITGIVFSGATNFKLPNNSPSIFTFAGQDGVISGWNKGNPKNGIKMVDNSATASYFGLALANSQGLNYLYAANFKAGTIDVFDSTWSKINKQFIDPNLPAKYSPFNIQKIGNQLYVLYAKVGVDGNEIHAPGLGIIDIFNTDGSFVKRFISDGGALNSPWGITKAPTSFFGSDSTGVSDVILVGNFGDGRINAYNANGTFLGPLKSKGQPVIINGIWALSFAPVTATTIDPNRLYFEAGPNTEKDGLFGYIKK
ncbi:MAG: TIGR03118 family protein [Flavisolibacter sp.]